MSYTIYKHITPSNKVYIGITSRSVEQRWGKDGCFYKECPKFYRAIQKYGWDNIQHIVIRTGLTEEEAKIAEKSLIRHYHSREYDFGYNVSAGGDISPAKLPEVRKKLSLKKQGQNNPNYGKQLSDEQKAAIGKAAKNRIGKNNARSKKVGMYHKQTTELIQIFYGTREAERETGISHARISDACLGKQKTAGGYIWKYL